MLAWHGSPPRESGLDQSLLEPPTSSPGALAGEQAGVPRSVSLDGSGRLLAVQVSRNGRWDVDLIRLP